MKSNNSLGFKNPKSSHYFSSIYSCLYCLFSSTIIACGDIINLLEILKFQYTFKAFDHILFILMHYGITFHAFILFYYFLMTCTLFSILCWGLRAPWKSEVVKDSHGFGNHCNHQHIVFHFNSFL